MSHPVLRVFPKRIMHIRKTGVTHPALSLVGVAFFLACAAALLAYMLPDVQAVWRIANEPVEAADAQIASGRCKPHRTFFITCEAKVSYAVNGRSYTKEISFSYLDIDSAPRSASVVYAASDPALATLDVAVDKIWHSIGALAGFQALLVGLGVACFVQMVRNSRARRTILALNGKCLTPVGVTVTEVKENGAFMTQITYHAPGQSLATTSMGRKALPFYLDMSPDNTMAVALTDSRGQTVLLLDEKLERVDFTEAERKALYAARAQLAQPQAAA